MKEICIMYHNLKSKSVYVWADPSVTNELPHLLPTLIIMEHTDQLYPRCSGNTHSNRAMLSSIHFQGPSIHTPLKPRALHPPSKMHEQWVNSESPWFPGFGTTSPLLAALQHANLHPFVYPTNPSCFSWLLGTENEFGVPLGSLYSNDMEQIQSVRIGNFCIFQNLRRCLYNWSSEITEKKGDLFSFFVGYFLSAFRVKWLQTAVLSKLRTLSTWGLSEFISSIRCCK